MQSRTQLICCCLTRFIDFLLPMSSSERELLLSRDQRFLRRPRCSCSVCNCCCCCYSADKRELDYSWSTGDVCLAQLLQREIDAHRVLEIRRRILSDSPDFLLLAAFQFVEDPSLAAVTPLSLAEALAEEGFVLTQMDQKLIFRRLDRSSCH